MDGTVKVKRAENALADSDTRVRRSDAMWEFDHYSLTTPDRGGAII